MIQQNSADVLWGQIVASAWSDDAVMKRLRSDPRALFAEYSLEIPEDTDVEVREGAEVKVLTDSNRVRQFIFPLNPPELTDEDLLGGVVAWCGCAACRSAACARCAACAACGACGRCGCRCW
jgi:hypothetical protein